MAQGWVGGVVAAARAAAPKVRVFDYNLWARYDQGFQATPWPMAERLGLPDVPSEYGVENGLEVLAQAVRAERQAVGAGTPLVPWVTPGTCGDCGGGQTDDPGRALRNQLIQLFANGATGFSVYPSVGVYDMSLWLAMRDVIELLTPFEDLLCDGTPATTTDVFPALSDTAVVSAMAATCDCPCPCAPAAFLVASSTIPHGLFTQWSIRAPTGVGHGWRLCDLATNRSVLATANGTATWTSRAEDGSVLLFSATTPCDPVNAL
jgi:hypothetical protein